MCAADQFIDKSGEIESNDFISAQAEETAGMFNSSLFLKEGISLTHQHPSRNPRLSW